MHYLYSRDGALETNKPALQVFPEYTGFDFAPQRTMDMDAQRTVKTFKSYIFAIKTYAGKFRKAECPPSVKSLKPWKAAAFEKPFIGVIKSFQRPTLHICRNV